MKISELINILSAVKITQGDMPIVLWDLDSGGYFELNEKNIEFQVMEDDSARLSVGVNDYNDKRAELPLARGELIPDDATL